MSSTLLLLLLLLPPPSWSFVCSSGGIISVPDSHECDVWHDCADVSDEHQECKYGK